MQDIATTNTLRKQSDYGNDIMQQNLNRYAGTNYMYNAVGKQGMKLMSIEQAKLILMMRKNVEQKNYKYLQTVAQLILFQREQDIVD